MGGGGDNRSGRRFKIRRVNAALLSNEQCIYR